MSETKPATKVGYRVRLRDSEFSISPDGKNAEFPAWNSETALAHIEKIINSEKVPKRRELQPEHFEVSQVAAPYVEAGGLDPESAEEYFRGFGVAFLPVRRD